MTVGTQDPLNQLISPPRSRIRRVGSAVGRPFKAVSEKASGKVFKLVHGRNLVYNQCWEDPRLDRVALELTPEDRLVVITSAGCNAIDYALAGCGEVHAVDMNFRQNALLELKRAACKTLPQEEFFDLMGRGKHDRWNEVFGDAIRPQLSAKNAAYWDRNGWWFAGRGAKGPGTKKNRRDSFYFYGTSGTFAWWASQYCHKVAKLAPAVEELLECQTVEAQKECYEKHELTKRVWRPFMRWALKRDSTFALLGVPRAQRQQLDRDYPGGILQFVIDRFETVMTKLPLHENYAWRVYLTGKYTPTCCPEYLRADLFETLRGDHGEPGAIDRVTSHTSPITEFLGDFDGADPAKAITRFVLLDHMDWLSAQAGGQWLRDEWTAIFRAAAPGARVIWRSAGLSPRFFDDLEVERHGKTVRVGDVLTYNEALAAELHPVDRVNTYGSFAIADLPE